MGCGGNFLFKQRGCLESLCACFVKAIGGGGFDQSLRDFLKWIQAISSIVKFLEDFYEVGLSYFF